MSITYIRYWGSYFKRPRHCTLFAGIMRSVAEAGWKSYIVCSRPPADSQLAEKVLETGTEIVYLPRAQGNFDIGCIWRTYKLCKRLHCSIFHCDNKPMSPLIGAALAGVPVRLWSKRSMNQAYEKMRQATFRDRVAISVRISSWLATRILPVSDAVKNELVDLGIPSSKIIVCPNPVEVGEINENIRRQARSELGYTDGKIVFTTIGHAVLVKGWDVLIRSFARIAGEYPKLRLQLIGSVTGSNEQEYYSMLEKCVREWDIADYVRFLGPQLEITKVLAATDVFVLPSRSEGNSNALLEALMYGLPCIATKVGYATNCIQDGVNGLLIERGSEDQLTNAMISLAKNQKLRRQIANAVQAKKKYAPTFSEYGDQLVELYKKLLQGRKKHTDV